MLKSKKIILIVLISLGLLGLVLYSSQTIFQNSPPPNLPLIKGEEQGGGQAILEINGTKYESEAEGQISVYDFMNKLRDEGKIEFTEKNYTGMGKFIISINGTKGNGEQNWIYYVNGIEAQVGVSNYKIKAGDIVSWKYEKANY